MTQLLTPGAGLVFMKVGIHAQESLEHIIARKSQEIADTGIAMWGYGGNTCHPRTMVQPFGKLHADTGKPIFLCMEEMQSSHWAVPVVAAEYSVDGEDWRDIPEKIEVKGSRFALVISSLEEEHFEIPLEQTRVAVGLNRGRLGSRYINGRVDKACLEVTDGARREDEGESRILPISLVARLTDPFAVFLRGSR